MLVDRFASFLPFLYLLWAPLGLLNFSSPSSVIRLDSPPKDEGSSPDPGADAFDYLGGGKARRSSPCCSMFSVICFATLAAVTLASLPSRFPGVFMLFLNGLVILHSSR